MKLKILLHSIWHLLLEETTSMEMLSPFPNAIVLCLMAIIKNKENAFFLRFPFPYFPSTPPSSLIISSFLCYLCPTFCLISFFFSFFLSFFLSFLSTFQNIATTNQTSGITPILLIIVASPVPNVFIIITILSSS